MVLNAMCGTTKLGKSLAIIYNYLYDRKLVKKGERLCVSPMKILYCVHTLLKKNKVHPPFPKVSNFIQG